MASGAPVREQYADLEGLRGVAIALVLLAHAHVPGLRAGLFGVDVFFVLSGYLITRNLLAWTGSGGELLPRYAGFLLRRVARLVPALLVTLVLLVAWVSLGDVPGGGVCLVRAATYTMNLPFGTAQTCAGPLHVVWSLAAEQQFYLVWPLVLVLLAPLSRTRAAHRVLMAYALIAAAVASLALLVPGAGMAVDYAPAGRPLALLPGAAIALAGPAVRRVPRPLLPLVGGFAAVGLLLTHLPQVALAPLVALPTALLIRELRREPSATGRVLSAPVLTWLGRISYSLYLVHVLALWVSRELVDGPWADVLGCGVAVLLATLLHRFVEEPSRRWGYAVVRRWERARDTQLLTVARG